MNRATLAYIRANSVDQPETLALLDYIEELEERIDTLGAFLLASAKLLEAFGSDELVGVAASWRRILTDYGTPS